MCIFQHSNTRSNFCNISILVTNCYTELIEVIDLETKDADFLEEEGIDIQKY